MPFLMAVAVNVCIYIMRILLHMQGPRVNHKNTKDNNRNRNKRRQVLADDAAF